MPNGAPTPGRKVAPEPQQGTPIVPKQITYPTANAQVELMAGGGRALILATPFEVLVFPMSGEAAAEIGHQLAAPSIEVPSGPLQ